MWSVDFHDRQDEAGRKFHSPGEKMSHPEESFSCCRFSGSSGRSDAPRSCWPQLTAPNARSISSTPFSRTWLTTRKSPRRKRSSSTTRKRKRLPPTPAPRVAMPLSRRATSASTPPASAISCSSPSSCARSSIAASSTPPKVRRVRPPDAPTGRSRRLLAHFLNFGAQFDAATKPAAHAGGPTRILPRRDRECPIASKRLSRGGDIESAGGISLSPAVPRR